MKRNIILSSIIMIINVLFISCNQNNIPQNKNDSKFPELKGPYLSQKPPGDIPELFAPGIISTGFNVQRLTFSPDGKECFYSVIMEIEIILWIKFQNGMWTEPEVAPFSGKYYDGYPSFHPDGTKLYFHSYRPENGGNEPSKYGNIWIVERTESGWGVPRILGPAINGKGTVSGPSVSKNGTLYFSQYQENGEELAMRSELINGVYQSPKPLPPKLRHSIHFCISPDESFLIIPKGKSKELPGGGGNYYVTFRNDYGEWSDLIDLGDEIRSICKGGGINVSISTDGKYFFFEGRPKWKFSRTLKKHLNYKDLQEKLVREPTYDRGAIFWVDSSLINKF